MFNFLVLSEIAEEELAELSQYSNGDPEMEKVHAEARRDRRRTKITQEMFETEKTYLNHLELVNKVSYYEKRMMQMIEKIQWFPMCSTCDDGKLVCYWDQRWHFTFTVCWLDFQIVHSFFAKVYCDYNK